MPSTSKAEARFMQAVAHDPKFASKVGVAQSVGKDFAEADKGRSLARLPEHTKKPSRAQARQAKMYKD